MRGCREHAMWCIRGLQVDGSHINTILHRSVTGDHGDGWTTACWLNLSHAFMLKKSKASSLLHHGVSSKCCLKSSSLCWRKHEGRIFPPLTCPFYIFRSTVALENCTWITFSHPNAYVNLLFHSPRASQAWFFPQCIQWKSSFLCYYNDYVGEELPLSAFCRTSVGEWDAFRSIDMDAEVASTLLPVLLFTWWPRLAHNMI